MILPEITLSPREAQKGPEGGVFLHSGSLKGAWQSQHKHRKQRQSSDKACHCARKSQTGQSSSRPQGRVSSRWEQGAGGHSAPSPRLLRKWPHFSVLGNRNWRIIGEVGTLLWYLSVLCWRKCLSSPLQKQVIQAVLDPASCVHLATAWPSSTEVNKS